MTRGSGNSRKVSSIRCRGFHRLGRSHGVASHALVSIIALAQRSSANRVLGRQVLRRCALSSAGAEISVFALEV